jgi:glycosyltransferase involved in cell wall biosynthesis
METPLLSVCLITYNHEKFIRQAIEGILMQEINFKWELIIADDCSTDKTREIILEYKKQYPDFIKLIFQEKNVGPAKNWLDLISAPKSKYIAYLEGDDYWTDPLKLQKQVDFLQNDETYSICWTKYLVKKDSDNSEDLIQPDWISLVSSTNNTIVDLNSIFSPYCTYSLTTLFKRESLDLSLYEKLQYGKDNSLYVICLSKGNGILMNFYSSVYRIHQGGVYSNMSIYKQKYSSYLNVKEITLKIPGCNNLNIRKIRNGLLTESIKLHPKQLSLSYLSLIIDAYKFIGFKTQKKLIVNKFKSGITR